MDLDWNAMSFASRTQHLESFLGCKVENASYRGKFYSGIIRRIHPSRRGIFLETTQPKCCFIDVMYNYPEIFEEAWIDGMTLNEFLAEVTKYSRFPLIKIPVDLTEEGNALDRSAEVEEFSDWPDMTSSELTGSSVEILDSPNSGTCYRETPARDKFVQQTLRTPFGNYYYFANSAEISSDLEYSGRNEIDQSFSDERKADETSGVLEVGFDIAEERKRWTEELQSDHTGMNLRMDKTLGWEGEGLPVEDYVTEDGMEQPEVAVVQSEVQSGESESEPVRIGPSTSDIKFNPSLSQWIWWDEDLHANREKNGSTGPSSRAKIPASCDNDKKPGALSSFFETLLKAVPTRDPVVTKSVQVSAPAPRISTSSIHSPAYPPRSKCVVCRGTTSVALRFGALACVDCSIFFIRAVCQGKVQRCLGEQPCVIDATLPNELCQECRLAKCLENGMQAPGDLQDSIKNEDDKYAPAPTSDLSVMTPISGTGPADEIVPCLTAGVQGSTTSSKMEKDQPSENSTSSFTLVSKSESLPAAVSESPNRRNAGKFKCDDVFNFTKSGMPAYLFMNAMSLADPDTFVVSKDGVRYSAHKFILGARSSVLKTFFKCGGLEVRMDHSGEVVEAFLQLIYARPCPDLAKHLVELVEMFGEFGVFGEMEEMAERGQVEEAITTENAASFFFTAPMNEQYFIWARAMEIVQKNYHIEESEEFRRRAKVGLTLKASGIKFLLDNVQL